MAITYTWTIPNCEREIATGGIKIIHWRCIGVDGDHSSSNYGTVGLTFDSTDADFVAYEDVTQETAQGWVWEHISQSDVEALIASEIEKQKNPTEGTGVPWS
jgi:hypothetical protein